MTSMAANRAIPGRSSAGTGPVRAVCGSRSAPNTKPSTARGMLTAKTAGQPATPTRNPPSVGPITAIVCVEMAKSVRIAAGLSWPVRSASLRIRYIAAG